MNEKPERIKLVRSHTMKSLRLCESHQFSGSVVKRFLSIFSALILNSGVDRGMPNLAAAPTGPNTRPELPFRASSMMFFSCASSLRGSSMWRLDSVAADGKSNQLSSIEKNVRLAKDPNVRSCGSPSMASHSNEP